MAGGPGEAPSVPLRRVPHRPPRLHSCLEFLLDNGADPSLRDRQGYTAVHYAAAYGNRQNLELVRASTRPGGGWAEAHGSPLGVGILKPRGCCITGMLWIRDNNR